MRPKPRVPGLGGRQRRLRAGEHGLDRASDLIATGRERPTQRSPGQRGVLRLVSDDGGEHTAHRGIGRRFQSLSGQEGRERLADGAVSGGPGAVRPIERSSRLRRFWTAWGSKRCVSGMDTSWVQHSRWRSRCPHARPVVGSSPWTSPPEPCSENATWSRRRSAQVDRPGRKDTVYAAKHTLWSASPTSWRWTGASRRSWTGWTARRCGGLLDRGAPLRSVAVALGEGTLDGVAAAHASGPVHRDLKPENVLIGADGVPRVTDFGISRALDRTRDGSQTQESIGMGTPGDMAPDVVVGGASTTSLHLLLPSQDTRLPHRRIDLQTGPALW